MSAAEYRCAVAKTFQEKKENPFFRSETSSIVSDNTVIARSANRNSNDLLLRIKFFPLFFHSR